MFGEHSSKLVRLPAASLCEIDSSFSACAGDVNPIKAVSSARGLGNSFSASRGDDAERAFGADEEIAQVVAGIVFFQLRQAVENTPVGQHHFQPERHLARHAIGERGGAAGIGGEIAADGAASFRAQ